MAKTVNVLEVQRITVKGKPLHVPTEVSLDANAQSWGYGTPEVRVGGTLAETTQLDLYAEPNRSKGAEGNRVGPFGGAGSLTERGTPSLTDTSG